VEVQRTVQDIEKPCERSGTSLSAPLHIVLPLAELHEEVTATNSQAN